MSRAVIVPYRPDSWIGQGWNQAIDGQTYPAALRAAMKDRWPDADIHFRQWPVARVARSFVALFSDWLQNQCQAVSFADGSEQSLVEFLLWYRTYINPSIRLLLLDEWSKRTLEVTAETTVREITEFAGH